MQARSISGAVCAPATGLLPERAPIAGRWARLEPLDPSAHADELYAASHGEGVTGLWQFLPYGPFADVAIFERWLVQQASATDPLFFAIREQRSGIATGMASLMEIRPEHGVIEIGHIWFSPQLQNTPTGTEALFLLMTYALDRLGYRRLEWKCDALNSPSRRAALRLGFEEEGVFYQHRIVKGRNRDTAWFSLLNTEWAEIRQNFETWLAQIDPTNGQQQLSLRQLNEATRGRVETAKRETHS